MVTTIWIWMHSWMCVTYLKKSSLSFSSWYDNILYMFYESFYVICILTYLYSLHKYRPLDHNTNYISQGARFVLIFSSLCLYCPVLDQELSELNGVCNIISLKTQIHVTRRTLSSEDPYPWGGEEDYCAEKSHSWSGCDKMSWYFSIKICILMQTPSWILIHILRALKLVFNLVKAEHA